VTMFTQTVSATDAIQALLETIEVQGVALSVYDYDPGRINALPAAVISLPEGRRPDIDDPEEELGYLDLWLDFPVTIYLPLRDPKESQYIARELVTTVAAALDEDFTLGGTARDCRLTGWTFDLDAQRTSDSLSLIVIFTTVKAHLKVAYST